ncbi:hypothetical protein B0H13DRAFT_2664450 [Mycena leptocephala]|nr:hypothetical protein B0H13DRAFT_2664450 [Mycena leptocephala]
MQPPEHYEKLDQEMRDNPELRSGDHYNVLLCLRGLDPHRDSAREISHTMLLGEDKYVWHETTKAWNDEQGALFAARLQSASLDGLNLPPLRARYMVQYKKSLIGMHFKALQQVGIFQLDAKLCSPALFELWKANGVLGALLWFPEIKDMDQQISQLRLKMSSIDGVLSNHQAPSLDIATTLADMERFKHQAGCEIQNFLTGNRQLQRRLGWTAHDAHKAGTVEVLSKSKRHPELWKNALGSDNLTEPIGHSGRNWIACKYAAARSQEPCFPGSWVFFVDGAEVARIIKILIPEHTHLDSEAVVVCQKFMVPGTIDNHYDMPLLIKTDETVVLKPEHTCHVVRHRTVLFRPHHDNPKTVPPPAPATESKTVQVSDVAATSLEVALEILKLLTDVTENVPYINTITGCIQKLIDIRKEMSDNKSRADELLDKIGKISRVVADGLHNLQERKSTASMRLSADMHRYQIVLGDTCDILEEWTSKKFLRRFLKHGEFAGIAEAIDRRLDAFHDVFSAALLISLSSTQDALDTKMQTLVDQGTQLVDQGIRTTLDKWLEPVKIGQSQATASGKRHTATGLWLVKERPEFKEWIYTANSFLWFYGISGCGKTILSSTIIDTLRGRAEHHAFFYFDTNSPDQRTVRQLLCSLVTQLSVQVISPDKTLNALWNSYTKGQHFPNNSALLLEALIPILIEFKDSVYIVLDALDECSERDELLHVITVILAAGLSNVHLLVTSRPEVPCNMDTAEQLVSVSLEGCMDEDIELYVTEMLSKELGWIFERKEEIKRRLLDCGNGMFRLVSLQLDELRNCDGRPSQVEKALKNMPNSLHTIYDRILENIKSLDMLSSLCRTINWLMFSKRLMMLTEIIDALAFDFEREPLRFSAAERMRPEAFLAACAGFVTVSGDAEHRTVKLAHSSVNEYFLLGNRPRLSGDCEISEQAAHHLLARTCIAYICSVDRVLDTERDLRQYPLTLYAVESWGFHFTLCHEIGLDNCSGADERHKNYLVHPSYYFSLFWALLQFLHMFVEVVIPVWRAARNVDVPRVTNHNRQLIDAVMQLLQPESPQYTTLIHLYDVDNMMLRRGHERSGRAPLFPPLYLAASVGIGQIVRELLERGADANTECGYFGNVLQAACSWGHTKIVRLLLESGADVNAQGGHYGNALQAASYQGHTEIAHLLLESGADVNAEGGEFGNALQAASIGESPDIVHRLLLISTGVNVQGRLFGSAIRALVCHGSSGISRLLLERGADVDAPGGEFGNALQAAAGHGGTETVRLLLERGVNANTQGGRYGNALQAASRHGYTKVARLLLESGANVNAPGGEFGTALQAASRWGHTETASLLLEMGAAVKMSGEDDGNAH